MTELARRRPGARARDRHRADRASARARGVEVHGIDASPAMVEQLRAKPGGDAIPVTIGDMADVPVDGAVRARLRRVQHVLPAVLAGGAGAVLRATSPRTSQPGGRFLIHAFVPDTSRVEAGQDVVGEGGVARPRAARRDRRSTRRSNGIDTTQVRITEQGIRLVHAKLRFALPPELDLMARLAGLTLEAPLGVVRQAARSPTRAPSTFPSIAHDLTGRVQAGDAGHAAAAVRRAARLVQTRRSACGSRRSRARAACGTSGRARARRGRCCRRSRPYSCSISYGPMTWRCRIESVKPGATASTRAMTRSAYASSSA